MDGIAEEDGSRSSICPISVLTNAIRRRHEAFEASAS
jgi:hypothetical protein